MKEEVLSKRQAESGDLRRKKRARAPILTEIERKVLRSVVSGGVKFAAVGLRKRPIYVYQVLDRVRKKIRRTQTFRKEIDEFKFNFPTIRKYLKVEDVE